MTLSIVEYLVKVRVAVCPRTAYASSGSAGRECLLYSIRTDEEAAGFAAEVAEFKESLLQTKEFHAVHERYGELTSNGNVTVVLVSHGRRGDKTEVLSKAQKLVSTQQAPLVVLLFDGADGEEVSPINPSSSWAGELVHRVEILNGYHVVSIFASVFSRNRSQLQGAQHPSSLGSKGQPSVQSGSQFAYLWRIWQEKTDDRLAMMDSGKERVLQRLAEHSITAKNLTPLPGGAVPAFVTTPKPPSNGTDLPERKYTTAEWDLIIRTCLKEGMEDFGVYDTVRLHTIGASLEQDLESMLPKPSDIFAVESAGLPGAAETSGSGVVSGEDGRASFMVNMTLQCVPDLSKRSIRSVLDYGCAEGAITAELGRQLGLTADRIFGADVRAIPAHGFTFLPLSAEDPEHEPSLGSILPRLATGSVDLVTSAMVMHHVTHVPATLLELRRVISPGGVLILREHHCPTAEMGAFLDIMHGLYSLAWSEPVEWPHFLSEYRAWYKTREEWESLVVDAGFMRLPSPSQTIQGHYDAALRSKKKPDGRYTNLIRAYYAVYIPRTDFELPLIPQPPLVSRTVKRRLEEDSTSGDNDHKRSKVESHAVFESRKHKGQFYILASDGKPVWVKLYQRGSRTPATHPSTPQDLDLIMLDDITTHAVEKITYAS